MSNEALRVSLSSMYAADQQMWEGNRGSRSAFENQVRIAWPTISRLLVEHDALTARVVQLEACLIDTLQQLELGGVT